MAVAMVVAQILVYLGATPLMTWWLLAKLITSMFWPVGGLVCLALSYLGEPLGLGEPGALRPSSPWIWMIAAPVAGLDVLVLWLESRYDLPESTVLGVLAAGLLYGLMRRRHHPAPDAGWASATWRLAALIVPTYAVSLVGMASTGGGSLDREIVAPTIMVAVLAAVGGCHLLSRRRIQLKRTRA